MLKRVFLSSTGRDLEDYREAVALAINRMDGFQCIRMEDFGARPEDPDSFCRAMAKECDVYVGLLGHLYGSVPPGEARSFTEREYDAAIEAEVPRLVFVAKEDFKLPKSLWTEAAQQVAQVERFHARVKSDLLVGSFEFGEGAPEELAGAVGRALHNWAATATKKAARPPRKKPAASKRSSPDLAEARRRYLQAVKNLYWLNPFKGLDRKGEHVFPVLDLYVDLKVIPRAMASAEGEGPAKRGRSRRPDAGLPEEMEAREPTSALELLQKNAGVVLLGHPGAGKTTFLKVLALKIATDQAEGLGLGAPRLPILIPISDYASALKEGQSLDDYIVVSCRRSFGDQPFDRLIKENLEAGTTLLLLDGLDEVRDSALQREVTIQVRRFYSYWHGLGNKFVLTSRIEGFADLRFHEVGLVEGTLADFDKDEIREFAGRWVRAVEVSLRGTSDAARWVAQQEEEGLLAAIFGSEALRELASNPLLLTILAIMKRQEVTLPEQRALLYQRYIEVLLQDWNKVRSVSERPVVTLNATGLLDVLSPLALWLQQKSTGLGLLRQKDLQDWLEDHFRSSAGAAAPAAAQQFLEELRQTSLLSERGPGLYGFLHRTFQEFLAARGLAKLGQTGVSPVYQAMCRWFGEDKWREVFRLAIGFMGAVEGRPKAVEDLLEMLLAAPEPVRHEATILAGDGLADLGEVGVRVEVRKAVAGALETTMRADKSVKAVDRARAGAALGALKDPRRPDVTTLAGMQFCWVPTGKLQMGEGEETHEADIPYGYWIGFYPVTVAQFQEYCDETDFKPEDPDSLRGLWNGPVNWVSWHEALGFCRWLSEEGARRWSLPEGWTVTLPSEAEWEKAARGGAEVPVPPVLAGWAEIASPAGRLDRNPDSKRAYPWGKGEDPNSSNYRDTGIGRPSAVGCFPGGASPIGCEELSGNVWEWTRSRFKEYPYVASDGREDLDVSDNASLVLRGGSVFLNSRFVRCAYRFRSLPLVRLVDIGFRLVVRPF